MTAPLAAVLERRDDGQLLLTWDSSLPRSPTLAVELGDDPDHFTGPTLSVDTKQGDLVVPAMPGRTYVRITSPDGSAVVAERRVAIPGTLNFRDVGGYPTRDGNHLRWGRLYRSEALDAVDREGAEALEALGVRTVFDLRRPAERTTVTPVSALNVVAIPVGSETVGERELAQAIMSGKLTSPTSEHLIRAYHDFVEDWGASFVQLLEALAHSENLPAVVHCSAGKDRTGLVVALLLSALGVDRSTVLDDYELTTRLRSAAKIEEVRPLFEAHDLDVDKFRVLYEAPRHVLSEVLEHIVERFGDVESYLKANGLQRATLAALKAVFVAS